MIKLIWICLVAHLLTATIYSQEIVELSEDPITCDMVDGIRLPVESEVASLLTGERFNVGKKAESIYTKNRIYWFYNGLLWRIDLKGVRLNCRFSWDGLFYETDNKVVYNGKDTSVTNMPLWELAVRFGPRLKKNKEKL